MSRQPHIDQHWIAQTDIPSLVRKSLVLPFSRSAEFDIESYRTEHFTHEQREKARRAGAYDKVLGEMMIAEATAQFRVENGRLSPEEDPIQLLEGARSDYDRRLAELAVADEVQA